MISKFKHNHWAPLSPGELLSHRNAFLFCFVWDRYVHTALLTSGCAGSSLLCAAFSSCGLCGLQGTGFSRCEAQALGSWASVDVAHEFSCSRARGVFLDHRSNTSPALAPLHHQEGPKEWLFGISWLVASRSSWKEEQIRRHGTSLVVQWLWLCFPVQGVQVWSLVRELGFHMPLGQGTKT